jgi:hypothetical protein
LGGAIYSSEDRHRKSLKTLIAARITEKEWDGTDVEPSRVFIRLREHYGWTGQRKSADAFLVTVTVPALWAARTAAWDVRST